MSCLDDPSFVSQNDPKGMMSLAEGFPDQCRKALLIAQQTLLPDSLSDCDHVVVIGMGGSAAGGDFLRELIHGLGAVSCLVCRDYTIPEYVGRKSLVIACSYSGNTEETLSAARLAISKGAKLLAITSGGELADLCSSHGFSVIRIPSGQPPRTALGFLFIPAVYACVKLGYLPDMNFERAFERLDECRSDWCVETPEARNTAKALATKLFGRVPLLYGLGGWQASVASRWKSQINENAKVMAFANAFPELNHNEIIGWEKAEMQNVRLWAVVLLENGLESLKMRTRVQVTTELIRDKADIHTVTARGCDLFEQILSLTYLGDYVSLYLAALNGVDPETIGGINVLKQRLSEVG